MTICAKAWATTFLVESFGEDGEFDPPLLGPGSYMIQSLPFDPNTNDGDPSPDSEFDVLEFSFSFAGPLLGRDGRYSV